MQSCFMLFLLKCENHLMIRPKFWAVSMVFKWSLDWRPKMPQNLQIARVYVTSHDLGCSAASHSSTWQVLESISDEQSIETSEVGPSGCRIRGCKALQTELSSWCYWLLDSTEMWIDANGLSKVSAGIRANHHEYHESLESKVVSLLLFSGFLSNHGLG